QTLPAPSAKLEPLALAVAQDVERRARLDRGHHTDQALSDTVPLGDLTGELLLRAPAPPRARLFQLEIRSARLRRRLLRVRLQRIAQRLREGREVPQQHALTVEEPLQPARRIERGQVTLQDQTVKAAQLADDAILIDDLKRGHGLSLLAANAAARTRTPP